MESIKRARDRLKTYPKLVANCSSLGTDYARCVALKENVMKGDCNAEFEAFKKCLMDSAKRMKTRL